ncbi:secondary thiamine-phosphate synthase enzyme YjbQ [Olegusella massiliensis]|uniref:secondary thiamine-phosphate synthase enzyme YjbQ n=1 Tax=Olegusella massiliensis TaxID=1776381 RepID=UPI0008389AF7|nr:secondary thiamine-phosphate synthase enzyme YjbQ [Olegusella massiliensis]MBS5865638.1 secondary thiamine-phosphate synthase enzyme YjbQ [Coriobacteriaceae bacterium]
MIYTISKTFLTTEYNQYSLITEEIEQAVKESGIKEGMVTVISRHTTAGITTNEALECLEADIDEFLGRLVPEDHPYAHARILKDYGSTAGNPTGHLKALLVGNHTHFFVKGGELDKGGAQEVYFCEFDGPSERTYLIQVIGD